MQVKTSTKEKFHVISIVEPVLSADMTGDIDELLLPYLQNDVKNIILNLKELQSLDAGMAEKLVKLQQNFYENNSSFVICETSKEIDAFLDSQGLLEIMNITPTESEAWDIIQMEEIERDLLDG